MKTILVVDDELASAEVLSLILEEEGYRTFCAANGQLALSRALDVRPQLVILDFMMPGRLGGSAASVVLTRGRAYGCSAHSQLSICSRTATRTVQMSSASLAVTRARTWMVLGVESVTTRLWARPSQAGHSRRMSRSRSRIASIGAEWSRSQ